MKKIFCKVFVTLIITVWMIAWLGHVSTANPQNWFELASMASAFVVGLFGLFISAAIIADCLE
jgi:hypothetical protein